MKNTMRKLTAALLALTCLPVTGLTAAADSLPWYWGSTTWDALSNYELAGELHGSQLYVPHNEARWMFEVTPRENVMRFVLRNEVDPEEGGKQIAEVLDAYFPRLLDSYDAEGHSAKYGGVQLWQDDSNASGRVFELSVTNFPENASEIEAGILLGLARRHLISEFYGWGETAFYQTGLLDNEILTYGSGYGTYDEESRKVIEIPYDWDSTQAYLDEHHPGYQVEQYEYEVVRGIFEDGTEDKETRLRYRIVPAEELTFREKVVLACELEPSFHLGPILLFMESSNEQSTVGRNALEQPGDVTLDCEIDIMDVIALNKHLLSVADLCDTAKGNADLNGDGTPDTVDALHLLKKVAGIAE